MHRLVLVRLAKDLLVQGEHVRASAAHRDVHVVHIHPLAPGHTAAANARTTISVRVYALGFTVWRFKLSAWRSGRQG